MVDTFKKPTARSENRRRGHMVVLFAVLLVLALAMLAFAIDTGVMMVAQTELQRSADSAVLAGASILSNEDLTEADVIDEATSFLTANGVASKDLDDDLVIEFGVWDTDTRTFSTTDFADATALRIQINSRENSLFFGSALGTGAFSTTIDAIAVTNASDKERDIMLVLDCSGSMDNDSSSPEQPMTAVKDGAQLLCDVVNDNDQVGLTIYNWEDLSGHETGRVEVDLTTTIGTVKSSVSALSAGFYTGGTNIAGGIHIGGVTLNSGARDGVQKELVVLTDGRANDTEPPYDSGYSADSSAVAWANDIRALGVIIHTISVGDGADHSLMAQIAGGSLSDENPLKGKHFAITGDIADYTDGLLEAFEEIGQGERRVAIVD